MIVKYSELIRDKILILLLTKSKEVTLVLGLLSVLLGLGFLLGNPSTSNYAPMLFVANQYTWGVLFIVYGGCRIWDALFDYGFIASSSLIVVGIWAWNFLLLSFTYYDSSSITPTEFLLVLPVFCEVWSLIINLYYNSYNREGG